MTLVRFEPFRELEHFGRRMNKIMKTIDNNENVRGRFIPSVDVAEDEKNVYIHTELPGIPKENVQVTVSEDRILTIRGEKKQEEKTEESGKNYVRIERSYGNFTRSFSLPDNVDAQAIGASFDNGVLNLTLPKTEPAKPKEVQVDIR